MRMAGVFRLIGGLALGVSLTMLLCLISQANFATGGLVAEAQLSALHWALICALLAAFGSAFLVVSLIIRIRDGGFGRAFVLEAFLAISTIILLIGFVGYSFLTSLNGEHESLFMQPQSPK